MESNPDHMTDAEGNLDGMSKKGVLSIIIFLLREFSDIECLQIFNIT